MDDVLFARAARLFAEDFDAPPAPSPPPEPVAAEPVYSAADLAAARDGAARESREAALAEASGTAQAAARRALADIAARIAAAREDVLAIAEESAEATARLLLDCFATAFPALSARHGKAEVAAILHAVLPAMRREPKIVVRLNPHLARDMTEEIQRLDPDPELATRVRIVPSDAIAPGDVLISWDTGGATRDTKALWTQIENILIPASLLTTPVTAPPVTPKEHALVE